MKTTLEVGKMKPQFTAEEVYDLVWAEMASIKRGRYTVAEEKLIKKILKDKELNEDLDRFYDWRKL